MRALYLPVIVATAAQFPTLNRVAAGPFPQSLRVKADLVCAWCRIPEVPNRGAAVCAGASLTSGPKPRSQGKRVQGIYVSRRLQGSTGLQCTPSRRCHRGDAGGLASGQCLRGKKRKGRLAMLWGPPGCVRSAVIRSWCGGRRYELGVQAGGPGRWMVARKLGWLWSQDSRWRVSAGSTWADLATVRWLTP